MPPPEAPTYALPRSSRPPCCSSQPNPLCLTNAAAHDCIPGLHAPANCDSVPPMHDSAPKWQSLRHNLQVLATSVAAEIRSYPRPITACDAQFNHLLELRRLVPEEMQRLDVAANDPGSTVEDFLRTS